MDDYHIVHLLVYWGCNNAVILTDDSGFFLESKHFLFGHYNTKNESPKMLTSVSHKMNTNLLARWSD